jgi:hypothetical protein
MTKTLIIEGVTIEAGQRRHVGIEIARLFDHTEMKIPVEVIRGKEDGPTIFISAAIHGDEINGIEIIRRLLTHKKLLSQIKGTLIIVPIVNVFGFNRNVRYLPDRRDLNRVFPGSKQGSLASQVAYKFMNEVVMKCDYGIDLLSVIIIYHRFNMDYSEPCKYSVRLIEKLQSIDTDEVLDFDLINKAIYWAKKYHDGQFRKSGEPYYTHPLEVSYMISEYQLTTDVIVTAILHDIVEDTKVTAGMILDEFGR